jgi:hypothetical protein
MNVPHLDPQQLLPLYQDRLEADQISRVQQFLSKGHAVTNFDVQRALFDGRLNKECGVAIKRHLLSLVDQGLVVATGQKRGRRYQWNVQGNLQGTQSI